MAEPKIVVVGTCDTKADEINYIVNCLREAGADPRVMDVSVLSDSEITPDYSRHDVAAAAGTDNAAIIALGDENLAMTKTAEGAANLARHLFDDGEMDGVLLLGGTMGTDLALDVASALPIGVPKMVLSTVSFSPMIPVERIPADLMMGLWAGGLYGLNEMSKASLRHASGAVVGAARLAQHDVKRKPVVAISSFGTSALSYIVDLVPALEARGFEAAVFHATGMGGRALASLAQKGELVAVMDFCLQEVGNLFHGSPVNSGADRLIAPGVPRLIGPAGLDMIDALVCEPLPEALKDHDFHQHNRLLTCAKTTPAQRSAAARHVAGELAKSDAPTYFMLPLQGICGWDREDGPLYDPEAMAAMADAFRDAIQPPVELIEMDCHINDDAYVAKALEIFDGWVADGVIAKPQMSEDA